MSDATPHPIDTEELRRLADAATEGPWEAYGTTIAAITGSGSCQGCSGLVSPAHEPSCYWSEIAGAGEADAEFIAAARTAIPALLDALAAAEHRATRAEKWAALWKETARRAIRGERILFRVNRQAREQMERERGALFRVAAERNDATERAEQAEARIKAVRALTDQADAAVEPGGDPRYSEGPMLTTARIRRALDGDA